MAWGTFLSCSPKVTVDPNSAEAKQAALISRGKASYMSNCTACHNMNPKTDGTLGPSVWGSSKELLEARIVHGTYPPGFKPKRDSTIMAEAPPTHAAADVEAIHAYLNQP